MTDHQWLIFCKVTGVWAFFLMTVWFAVGIGGIDGNQWMAFPLFLTCTAFGVLGVVVSVILTNQWDNKKKEETL